MSVLTLSGLASLVASIRDIRHILETDAKGYFFSVVLAEANKFPVKVEKNSEIIQVTPNSGLLPIFFPLTKTAREILKEDNVPGVLDTFLTFREKLMNGEVVSIRQEIYNEINRLPK